MSFKQFYVYRSPWNFKNSRCFTRISCHSASKFLSQYGLNCLYLLRVFLRQSKCGMFSFISLISLLHNSSYNLSILFRVCLESSVFRFISNNAFPASSEFEKCSEIRFKFKYFCIKRGSWRLFYLYHTNCLRKTLCICKWTLKSYGPVPYFYLLIRTVVYFHLLT